MTFEAARQTAYDVAIKALAEKCRRSFSFFVKIMWDQIISEQLVWGWHMDVFCAELEAVAHRVMARKPSKYDLIINVSPGTTKSTICSQMYPAWCWIARVPASDLDFAFPRAVTGADLRFITASYSSGLSLEHAEYTRDIVRSDKYKKLFPEIHIQRDKEKISHFKNNKRGSRFSTSVGATATGMHGHIIIVDDPLNPHQAISDTERETANRWMDGTLSQRKIDKRVTPTILIMQRLHPQDPSGHWLEKKSDRVRHVNLPACTFEDGFVVKPPEYSKYYVDGLFDPVRMPIDVLDKMLVDLGSLQYAAQAGQNPRTVHGSLFKRSYFEIVGAAPAGGKTARGWDLAGTSEVEAMIKRSRPAYTASVKIRKVNDVFYVMDATRERLSPNGVRQALVNVSSQDEHEVIQDLPQDPGQAGKAQVQLLISLLAGKIVKASPESGDKLRRAEPFAAQCEAGNVKLVRGAWNQVYLNELADFPNSTYKDQVDASSRAFARLVQKGKKAGAW